MFYKGLNMYKNKRKALGLLLIISISLSLIVVTGCATILKGPTEDVNFSSAPGGAKVYVNGYYMGILP